MSVCELQAKLLVQIARKAVSHGTELSEKRLSEILSVVVVVQEMNVCV